MKKSAWICILSALVMCGCADPQPKIEQSSDETITEEIISATTSVAEANAMDSSEDTSIPETKFCGFDAPGETPILYNSVTSLNRNGLLYSGEMLVYSSPNGDLMCGDSVLCADVDARSINVYGDTVYFISGRDDHVYSVIAGSAPQSASDMAALLFFKTDRFDLLLDTRHRLYLCEGETPVLVSDRNVAWVDLYGCYVIFCEFGNGSRVCAYDTENNAVTQLLDYGFYPTVHDDLLYYQEKEHGSICTLNLTNGETDTVLERWGQQFSFVDDALYYTDSSAIFSADGTAIYRPEEDQQIELLFDCGNELFFAEVERESGSMRLCRLNAAGESESIV